MSHSFHNVVCHFSCVMFVHLTIAHYVYYLYYFLLLPDSTYRFMVLFQIRESLLRRDQADLLKPTSTRSSGPNNNLTEALLESNTAMDGSLETGGGGMGVGDGDRKWWEH